MAEYSITRWRIGLGAWTKWHGRDTARFITAFSGMAPQLCYDHFNKCFCDPTCSCRHFGADGMVSLKVLVGSTILDFQAIELGV